MHSSIFYVSSDHIAIDYNTRTLAHDETHFKSLLFKVVTCYRIYLWGTCENETLIDNGQDPESILLVNPNRKVGIGDTTSISATT